MPIRSTLVVAAVLIWRLVDVEGPHDVLVNLEALSGGRHARALHAVDGTGRIAKVVLLHTSTVVDVDLPEPEGGRPGAVLIVGDHVGVGDQSQIVVEIK